MVIPGKLAFLNEFQAFYAPSFLSAVIVLRWSATMVVSPYM